MKEIAQFCAALSDPTRLRLLQLLRDGEICVCFLQGVLQTSQPKISRHLAFLKRAGLVRGRRDGKWIYYSLDIKNPGLKRIFLGFAKQLDREPLVKSDRLRLRGICCFPSRYGLSPAAKPCP
jgi:ArsR family transcriptional regulator